MNTVVSVCFFNKVNFNYSILHQNNPAIIRGEFFRQADREQQEHMGILLEVNRPTLDEAIDVIHNCSKLIADEM